MYARTRTHVSTCEIRVLCTYSSLHCALRAEPGRATALEVCGDRRHRHGRG